MLRPNRGNPDGDNKPTKGRNPKFNPDRYNDASWKRLTDRIARQIPQPESGAYIGNRAFDDYDRGLSRGRRRKAPGRIGAPADALMFEDTGKWIAPRRRRP